MKRIIASPDGAAIFRTTKTADEVTTRATREHERHSALYRQTLRSVPYWPVNNWRRLVRSRIEMFAESGIGTY